MPSSQYIYLCFEGFGTGFCAEFIFLSDHTHFDALNTENVRKYCTSVLTTFMQSYYIGNTVNTSETTRDSPLKVPQIH